MKDRRTKPEWQKEIAEERIKILFREAKEAAKKGDLKYANRYVFLARKLGMKFNIKLGSYKKKFCKHCYHYLVPSKNAVIRTNPKTQSTEVKCLDCKKITRYPYIKEKRK